jgi:S1-C subfamily serine protease
MVPIDLLSPILDDLLQNGRPNRPPRPWLGLYAAEIEDNAIIVGVVDGAPAERADLRQGDVVIAVAGEGVTSLASLFRRIWSLGPAGVAVPMTLLRDGVVLEVTVTSGDRNRYLKAPRLH